MTNRTVNLKDYISPGRKSPDEPWEKSLNKDVYVPAGKVCEGLHKKIMRLPKHKIPQKRKNGVDFENLEIPENGLYFFFEKGEEAHGTDRLVRVGINMNGEKNYKKVKNRDTIGKTLKSRISQHFNADPGHSAFSAYLLDAIIYKKMKKTYAEVLESTGSLKEAYEKTKGLRDERVILKTRNFKGNLPRFKEHKKDALDYLQGNFSYTFIGGIDKLEKRKHFETAIIRLASNCPECRPSGNWIGRNVYLGTEGRNTTHKLRESGLWLVQHVFGSPVPGSGEIKKLDKYMDFTMDNYT